MGIFIESNADDFIVTTRTVSRMDDGAIFEFEARAEKSSPLTLQWRVGSGRNVGAFNDQDAQDINLSSEWKTYRLPLAYKNRLRGLRFLIPDKNTSVDIRHARILTVDGSETLKYQFN